MILKPGKFTWPPRGGRLVPNAAHWEFNEGSGSIVNDLSGNGNDGTVGVGTTWVPGKFGSATNHSQAAHEIVVADNSILTQPNGFSIVVWANIADITAAGRLVDKYETNLEFEFGLSAGILYGWVYDDTNNTYRGRYLNPTSAALINNKWHQIVYTYDGGITCAASKLHVDAIRKDNNDFDGGGTFVAIRNTNDDFKIGGTGGGVGGPFIGKIGSVAMYNYTLSSSEIAQLYRMMLLGTPLIFEDAG